MSRKKIKRSIFIPLEEVREALRLAGHQIPEDDETNVTLYIPGSTHMAATWKEELPSNKEILEELDKQAI